MAVAASAMACAWVRAAAACLERMPACWASSMTPPALVDRCGRLLSDHATDRFELRTNPTGDIGGLAGGARKHLQHGIFAAEQSGDGGDGLGEVLPHRQIMFRLRIHRGIIFASLADFVREHSGQRGLQGTDADTCPRDGFVHDRARGADHAGG
ncbi:MAG: hypothetical protein NTY53_17195, partial [Kiritimatiellaeota bacterium]|nr:hypothetical protein [Kiritimatiellota bacterium]